MPRGNRSSQTDKQKRNAEQITRGSEKRGHLERETTSRSRSTVNRESGSGQRLGGGRGGQQSKSSSRSSGKLSGSASGSRTAEQRSASARKGAETRKRNARGRA